MVKMASLSSVAGCVRLFGVFAMAVLLLSSSNLVKAQTYQDRDLETSEQLQRSPEDRTARSSNLPDWAKPADPSSNDIRREEGASLEGSLEPKAPPPGGEPVPVDGGLALLAAAGAGYAVRKLKEGEDEDEDPA